MRTTRILNMMKYETSSLQPLSPLTITVTVSISNLFVCIYVDHVNKWIYFQFFFAELSNWSYVCEFFIWFSKALCQTRLYACTKQRLPDIIYNLIDQTAEMIVLICHFEQASNFAVNFSSTSSLKQMRIKVGQRR